MTKPLNAALLLLFLPTMSTGQVLEWAPGQKEFPSVRDLPDQKPESENVKSSKPDLPLTTWRITASPVDQPVPALRWRLSLPRSETRPGQLAVPISRALVSMRNFARHPEIEGDYLKNSDRWLETDIDQLPIEEIQAYVNNYRFVLDELHDSVYLRDTGYRLELDGKTGSEIISMLLPEYQELRGLARLLRIDARLAIAQGRYEYAFEAIQAGYRLGEFCSRSSDFIISQLVGYAIIRITQSSLEELIAQPDGPNMYWALASLPDTMFDMRESIEAESTIFTRFLPLESKVDRDDLSERGWAAALVESMHQYMQIEGGGVSGPDTRFEKRDRSRAKLITAALVASYSDRSRRQLIAWGTDPKTVTSMSSAQAVATAFARDGIRLRDNFFKWSMLPGSMLNQWAERSEQELKILSDKYNPTARAAHLLLPAMAAASEAQMRTRQQIAMLITAEALRVHAFHHDGKLPDSLADCSPLPAWPDPRNSQAFQYRRTSDHQAEIERSCSPKQKVGSILQLHLRSN